MLVKRWLVGGSVMALLLALGSAAYATPVTITDPYGQGSPDVVGDPAAFDIQKIVFTSLTASQVTAEIYFNSASSPTNATYNYLGVTLAPGDLLFDVGGTYKYGVALTSHDGLTAGDVYKLGTLYTAFDKLDPQGASTGSYRPSEYVQIHTGTLDATGTVNVASNGNPDYKVTLNFDPSNQFWTDVLTAPGGMSVHFASATCANDLINGTLDVPSSPASVPEPGTLLLLGSGLLGVVAGARRRLARK